MSEFKTQRLLRALMLGLICGAFALAAQAAPEALEASRHTAMPRSADGSGDGIGKPNMGREIAGEVGWQGAAWRDRQVRERKALVVVEYPAARSQCS